MKMTAQANGVPYSAFIANGWTREKMLEHGFLANEPLKERIMAARAELFILTLLVRDGIENGFNNNALELQCTRAEDAFEAVNELSE